jgi:hydroxymethylpyrimidine/phosphomethylpyrimidine kinase
LATKPICLSIAGSDSSSGAGIQADLKTFSALKCYGMTVLTASTAQTHTQISDCHYFPAQHVKAELNAILNHYPVTSIKIGMLGSSDVLSVVSNILRQFQNIPIVIDPVLSASCHGKLNSEDLARQYMSELAPLATVLTPNLPEAEALFSTSTSARATQQLKSGKDEETVIENIQTFAHQNSCYVLLKGGHGAVRNNKNKNGTEQPLIEITDTLFCPRPTGIKDNKNISLFTHPRIDTKNTHGTGCTLSSAIAAYLARGTSVEEAIKRSEAYLQNVLQNSNGFMSTQHPKDSQNWPIDHFL